MRSLPGDYRCHMFCSFISRWLAMRSYACCTLGLRNWCEILQRLGRSLRSIRQKIWRIYQRHWAEEINRIKYRFSWHTRALAGRGKYTWDREALYHWLGANQLWVSWIILHSSCYRLNWKVDNWKYLRILESSDYYKLRFKWHRIKALRLGRNPENRHLEDNQNPPI